MYYLRVNNIYNFRSPSPLNQNIEIIKVKERHREDLPKQKKKQYSTKFLEQQEHLRKHYNSDKVNVNRSNKKTNDDTGPEIMRLG